MFEDIDFNIARHWMVKVPIGILLHSKNSLPKTILLRFPLLKRFYIFPWS